ncbi:hypothetical protein BKA80DRAFT_253608 [Phyllosticta citrichinensis]
MFPLLVFSDKCSVSLPSFLLFAFRKTHVRVTGFAQARLRHSQARSQRPALHHITVTNFQPPADPGAAKTSGEPAGRDARVPEIVGILVRQPDSRPHFPSNHSSDDCRSIPAFVWLALLEFRRAMLAITPVTDDATRLLGGSKYSEEEIRLLLLQPTTAEGPFLDTRPEFSSAARIPRALRISNGPIGVAITQVVLRKERVLAGTRVASASGESTRAMQETWGTTRYKHLSPSPFTGRRHSSNLQQIATWFLVQSVDTLVKTLTTERAPTVASVFINSVPLLSLFMSPLRSL